jgi:hypothetical protein
MRILVTMKTSLNGCSGRTME